MTSTNQPLARSRTLLAVLLAGSALALGACNKTNDTTAGQKVDSAVAKTESSAKSAESGMKQGAGEAKDAVKDAATTVGNKVDDASITAKVSAGLAKDPDLSAIKIDVDTKGGIVTLAGPAPTAAAKARAGDIAKSVEGVASVDNKLEVKM